MRILLDTNVLVRATPASLGGPAWQLLDAVLMGEHVLLCSIPLLFELDDVLHRQRLQVAIGLTSQMANQFMEAFAAAATLVDVAQAPAIAMTSDPKDSVVLTTAIVGSADVICTLDRHFQHPDVLAVCRSNGIRIMNDVELLNELQRLSDSP